MSYMRDADGKRLDEFVVADEADLTAETTRATNAENGLDGRVDALETTGATFGDIVTHDASEFTTDAELAAETTARTAGDTANTNAIAAEATTRGNADITLQNNINAEATARTNAVGAEATARTNADAALQALIDMMPLPADSLLRSVSLGMYGNSYGAKTAAAEYIYFDRLRSAMGSPAWNNLAVAGSLAADAASFAYGTFTKFRQGTGASAAVVTNAAGTFFPGVASIIYIIDIAGNDAGWDGVTTSGGTTAKSRAGFANGLDALIRRIRASSVIDDPVAADVVYTGAWTHNTTSTYASSAKVSFTSTPNDKVVFTETGTDFDLILFGYDASGSGSTGAAYEIRVDGTLFASGTSNNQTRKTQSGAGNFGLGQLAVPIRGLSAGSHTIEAKHVGSAGQFLAVDCLLVASTAPPTIIVCKTPELPAAGYATYVSGGGTTASRATFDLYDTIIDTVVAPFTADGSVVVFDPKANGFNPTTMIGSADGLYVHLNDRGNAFYAGQLLKIIRNLAPRHGLVLGD